MKTFLLYWNPHFSSYSPERFLDEFAFSPSRKVLREDDPDWDSSPNFFDWSIYEYEKAKEGDRFIFVRVGYEKPTGIIGMGYFTSDPFEDEDWSGQDRLTYYVDMEWESIVDPTSDAVLPTEVLQREIPEVCWTKGLSGVEVSPEVAQRIEELWKAHLDSLQ